MQTRGEKKPLERSTHPFVKPLNVVTFVLESLKKTKFYLQASFTEMRFRVSLPLFI